MLIVYCLHAKQSKSWRLEPRVKLFKPKVAIDNLLFTWRYYEYRYILYMYYLHFFYDNLALACNLKMKLCQFLTICSLNFSLSNCIKFLRHKPRLEFCLPFAFGINLTPFTLSTGKSPYHSLLQLTVVNRISLYF